MGSTGGMDDFGADESVQRFRDIHERAERRSRRNRCVAVLLGVFAVAAGVAPALISVDAAEPETPPAWRPTGPIEARVRYAFVPEGAICALPPDSKAPPSEPVACHNWKVAIRFRAERAGDWGTPVGGHCDQGGQCTDEIELTDAVSNVSIFTGAATGSFGVPVQTTTDGRHLAYFSRGQMRFVGIDLPRGTMRPLSPVLRLKDLTDAENIQISPDGTFYAVSFSGADPRILLTEFAGGTTTTLRGYCTSLGVSRAAEAIAVGRTCPGVEEPARQITILDRRGRVTDEWPATDYGDLSPDGKLIATVFTDGGHDAQQFLFVLGSRTGRLHREIPLEPLSEDSYNWGYGWLDDDEFIVQADPPEVGGTFGYYAVNVRTGKTHRLRELRVKRRGTWVRMGEVRRKTETATP